jgi:hypothetical protein
MPAGDTMDRLLATTISGANAAAAPRTTKTPATAPARSLEVRPPAPIVE